MKKHILVVDDDRSFRVYLRTLLKAMGYRVTCLASGEEVLEKLAAGLRPSVVILDIIMKGMDGMEVLKRIRKTHETLPVIMLTGVDQTRTIVEAMKHRATDYLVKPFKEEEMEIVLRNVFEKADLLEEIRQLRSQLSQEEKETPIFFSEKMKEIERMSMQVAETDVTVLIQGPSGVGKEIVARRIHQCSARAANSFVKVNCAALPRELLESELFGYEKGAFTGAVRSKPGKFELADKGTIFLDEIGEMDLSIQAKLLHVLQDGAFSRLGGKENIRVDVRVLAATNKDLEAMVARQLFREDLFYRLNVITITVPPLCERKEEIPVFCDYFLKKFALKFNRKPVRLPERLKDLFLRHQWPGNVRELENIIKRYVVLMDEEAILSQLAAESHAPGPEDIDVDYEGLLEGRTYIPLKQVTKLAASKAEEALINRVLQLTRGNKRKAAEILEISYKALLYKIRGSSAAGCGMGAEQ